METVYIIKREAQEQTKETVDVLNVEVKEHIAEYTLPLAEFIHCINVANGTTFMNLDGEYPVSQEFREMAEDVMDCVTCGDYIITIDEQQAQNLLAPTNIIFRGNSKNCFYNRTDDCSEWDIERINKQLDFCECCSNYNHCNNVGWLNDRLIELENEKEI